MFRVGKVRTSNGRNSWLSGVLVQKNRLVDSVLVRTRALSFTRTVDTSRIGIIFVVCHCRGFFFVFLALINEPCQVRKSENYWAYRKFSESEQINFNKTRKIQVGAKYESKWISIATLSKTTNKINLKYRRDFVAVAVRLAIDLCRRNFSSHAILKSFECGNKEIYLDSHYFGWKSCACGRVGRHKQVR